jgi:nucleotide-binding universal stress UspA family protein
VNSPVANASTVLISLQPGSVNTGVLSMAGRLAGAFGATVTGAASSWPLDNAYGTEFIAEQVFIEDRASLLKEMETTERLFRDALQGLCPTPEWQMSLEAGSVSDFLCLQARGADLIVVAARAEGLLEGLHVANVGDLVLNSGRPVLIVPPDKAAPKLERVVVAWKNTREARRALSDALPLLKVASKVLVVELASATDRPGAEEQLADVSRWLAHHGVRSAICVDEAVSDEATSLLITAKEFRADVLVAGCYGHSRLRERVFGGVTRKLLGSVQCCFFLSH